MIPNQWYVVLESREVRAGRPVGALRLGRKMVFWRDRAGGVHAIADRCCHRGASLAAGEVVGDHVACPFHGFLFDGTGRVSSIPANGRAAPVEDRFRVTAWPVREAHGFIWLWWGEARADLPPLPFFEELAEGWSWEGSDLRDPWPVHYTRAIENQLDVVHLPFVHRTTIGRGNRSLVHGPRVEETEAGFDFWVHNVEDDGATKPLRPDEVDRAGAAVSLGFRFPHLWQNRLGDRMRIFAAFVPVDDEQTLICIRTYQKMFRVPGLSWLWNRLGAWMNLVILRQDKRVVVTQEPRRTWLTMGENLVQGDLPVAVYRRRRRALLQAAGLRDDGAAG